MLLMAVQPNVEAVSSYSFLQAGASMAQATASTAARARRKRMKKVGGKSTRWNIMPVMLKIL